MTLISIVNKEKRLQGYYVLAALAGHWTNAGHEVRVARRFAPDAGACILHLNQTRIAAAKVPPAPPGVAVLNARVLDISKRGLSSLMLTPDSDWPGQVIVKTNLNHFGIPEQGNKPKGWAARMRQAAAQVSWRHARRLPHKTYPVLPHLRRVPGWVWRDRSLVVEKFLPEREGDLYCLRGWMFFGSQGYGWRLFSTDPLVKTGTMVRHEYLDEVPDALRTFRAERGFDFGKFDYVMHEGQPVLLDANKTPTFTGDPASPRLTALATGIRDYLK